MKEKQYKLYMVLVGCTPKGRLTEQHDVYFGIGSDIQDLTPQLYAFWPDGGTLHIDAWREVTRVGEYSIDVIPRHEDAPTNTLFFLNLGGYKPGDFEEYHYKTLLVAPAMAQAVKQAKQSEFYRHTGYKGAESHIDEKYGLDVDDVHKVEDVLPKHLKERFSIRITEANAGGEDMLHIGYLKIKKK